MYIILIFSNIHARSLQTEMLAGCCEIGDVGMIDHILPSHLERVMCRNFAIINLTPQMPYVQV